MIRGYIHDRIEAKIVSKLVHHAERARYFFKNRHTGLAGLENTQVVALAQKEIRDYRVWKEINKRNKFYRVYNGGN